VVSQLTGALVRAVLVMVLIATPSMLLVDISADIKQMVALVALFMGLLTFVEYNSIYPSLVEFRDAPPFNRIRFLMLFATVFSLSTIQRGLFIPSTLTEFMEAVGNLIGQSMDFPYSPVRLATLMIADTASRVNLVLGFLLPFLIPAVVKVASSGFEPLTMTSPQTLIWTMTAWAFLPASLFMRGIAMGRLAELIQERRDAVARSTDPRGFAAA
jgi:hypothetical protein